MKFVCIPKWTKAMIFLIVHFGKEWKPGIQTRHAHIYGIIWGGCECKQTWWKAKWNVPVRLKQFKTEKRKVELKEKELEKVRLKEDVPGAILLREKPEECKSVCYRSSTSNQHSEANVHILTWYILPLVFYKIPNQGCSSSYLCIEALNNLLVSSY